MLVILRSVICLILLGCFPSLNAQTQSGGVDPFHVRNMNPFALIHGVPTASSSRLLSDGESYLQLTADVANNSIESDTEGGELIRLDGETYRLGLIWKRGFGADWQIGIEVPYLSHREGVMDGLIENWHDLLGLSNANRDDWSRNRLVYRYDNSEGNQFLVDRQSSGIGDIVLSLSHALEVGGDSTRRLAVHTSLKLPTGDSDALLGSGAADFALWLSGSEEHEHWRWLLHTYGQVGLLFKGEGDLLRDQQRDLVVFGSLGVGWRPREWIDLKAQIDSNSSHYHSMLDPLGRTAVMLTVGGSIHLDGDSRRIDISIGENLITGSVPDFIVNLAYVHRFAATLR